MPKKQSQNSATEAAKLTVHIVRYRPHAKKSADGWSIDFAPDAREKANQLFSRLKTAIDAISPEAHEGAEIAFSERIKHSRVTIRWTERTQTEGALEPHEVHHTRGYVFEDSDLALLVFRLGHAVMGQYRSKVVKA